MEMSCQGFERCSCFFFLRWTYPPWQLTVAPQNGWLEDEISSWGWAITLPKTNSSTLKKGHSKGKWIIFQPSIFVGQTFSCRGHSVTPTQTSCTIVWEIPTKITNLGVFSRNSTPHVGFSHQKKVFPTVHEIAVTETWWVWWIGGFRRFRRGWAPRSQSQVVHSPHIKGLEIALSMSNLGWFFFRRMINPWWNPT